jgi:hypothetical protein
MLYYFPDVIRIVDFFPIADERLQIGVGAYDVHDTDHNGLKVLVSDEHVVIGHPG